jgi:hypothetical protein
LSAGEGLRWHRLLIFFLVSIGHIMPVLRKESKSSPVLDSYTFGTGTACGIQRPRCQDDDCKRTFCGGFKYRFAASAGNFKRREQSAMADCVSSGGLSDQGNVCIQTA